MFALAGRMSRNHVSIPVQKQWQPTCEHISVADPDANVWADTVWVYTSMDGNLTEPTRTHQDDWTYAYMDGYHALSKPDTSTDDGTTHGFAAYISGSSGTHSVTTAIEGTTDEDALYQSERYGPNLGYDVPMENSD